MVSALAKIEIFSFWPKTLDYSKAAFGAAAKNVSLIEVS